MDELDHYFDAYAENALTAEEHAALRYLRDPAHVAEFVREAFVHWQLLAIGQRKHLQADVSESPAKGVREAVQVAVGARRKLDHGGPPPTVVRRRLGAAAIIAASIALAAAALIVWDRRDGPGPVMVAQLTKSTTDLAWSAGGSPAPGAFLARGQLLAIERGRLLTTLASGVQIVLEGPASLRLDSAQRVYLERGRITASVPRQASGFIVDSPVGRFLDLGTEYTLKLDEDGGCELHVFSGLVELQPAAGASVEGPLRIPEGRAMSYGAETREITILPYRVTERMSL